MEINGAGRGKSNMILIKDGRVIDPQSGADEILDIVTDGSRIKGIGRFERSDAYEETIEAAGMIVAPGLVDVHVHFRDPGLTYKEDIETGSNAAKAGGFTSVVCMANTKPVIDEPETVRYVIEKGKKTGINVYTCATITKGMNGRQLVDMDELRAAGAVGFTDDGVPLMNEILAAEAMEKAKSLDVPLSFHEEDPAFIENNGINRGAAAEKLGIGGSPAIAEEILVARDCVLALHTGAKVNIQHVSSGNSVDIIRLAKQLGAHVTCEVTPHHFSLTEEAVLEHGSLAKMNPPLRTAEDRRRIIEGIKDGTIDMIATDHAPHSAAEKAEQFVEAPSGIIGLETSLALAVTNLVRTGTITLSGLIEKMSVNPAKLYGFDAGYIAEGGPADIVIFSEDEKWTVKEFASKASNSPFIGEELFGKVKYTICKGEIVYRESKH